jgi:hypothetical protein
MKSMTVPTAVRPRPLAPGTIKPRLVNVRSVFQAAIRDGMIATDPTAQVRLPRLRTREAAMRTRRRKSHRAPWPRRSRRCELLSDCALLQSTARRGNRPAGRDVDFLRRQSIESAPATIPATSDDAFNPAFAPLSVGTVRCWSTSSRNPARSASASVGTRPADDTKFGSSNLGEVAESL